MLIEILAVEVIVPVVDVRGVSVRLALACPTPVESVSVRVSYVEGLALNFSIVVTLLPRETDSLTP